MDAGVNMSLSFVLFFPLLRKSLESRSILPLIALSAVETVFWIWLVVRFGLTPGKLVARIRIVDPTGAFPGWSRALLRGIPGILGGIFATVGINAAVHSAPLPVAAVSFMDLGRLLEEYGHPYPRLEHAITAFGLIDVGAVLLNRRRRAIHDFLAGTYVVTRESWTAREAQSPA